MSHYFKKYIKRQNHPFIPHINFKTNFTNCILTAFEQRGCRRTEGDDWDIIWSEKQFIPEIYEKRLTNQQRVNHFRNFYELCRKDQLIKNLKKHKKALEKDGKSTEAAQFAFYPQTFVLPAEYVLFAEEFKKVQTNGEKSIWIMKPTGKSQGKGIFLFNRLGQVSNWENHSAEPYIAQRYLSDPLLIGGKKFDLRVYALVLSYSPLTVYFYRGGFARFTHCRYDDTKLQNSQIHLTNVAVQKNSEGYDGQIGGKWYIDRLKHYFLTRFGEELANQSFMKIQNVVLKTLQAMQKIMSTQKPNPFELYGFDILIDSKLQPWLIEVNGSPSMTANTQKDHEFKIGLLDDTITVLDVQKFLLGGQQQIGGFDLISRDKTLAKQKQKPQKMCFLGVYNNRLQNLKKLAKSYAARLNDHLDNVRQTQKRRGGSSSVGQNKNPAQTNKTTPGGSKRNIAHRKYVAVPKALANGLNNANIASNQSVNPSSNQSVIPASNQSLCIPPKVNRDFLIKNKQKRQHTQIPAAQSRV